MDLKGYRKLFSASKRGMQLDEAAGYIHRLLVNDYPMLPKTWWKFNQHEYDLRLAQRAACMELEQTFRNAPPWEDWREIFATLEWPLMKRVGRHLYDKDIYSGPDGKKRGEADVWFLDMWTAYHMIFCRMPGGDLPDITPWKMYNELLCDARKKLKKYRRT